MRGFEVIVPLFEPDVPLDVTRAMLGIGLRSLVAMNVVWLMRHRETTPMLYDAGVVYEREPAGQEEWQTIPAVLTQGSGDCEDLAAWRVAELQTLGALNIPGGDRGARIITKTKRLPTGKLLIHVLVRRGDGSIEDPSLMLGMGMSDL